jgi:hypothetical protein
MTTQHENLRQKQIKAALWKRGELGFLLDSTQTQMKQAFLDSDSRTYILLCSRRLGKSYLLSDIALELAIKSKTKIIYATASYKAAKEIIRPLVGKLLDTCPTSARPQYRVQDSKYIFDNGSEILLIGLDKDPDGPRGQEADLVIIDEAGFVNKLDYLIGSVFTPMLLMTNGRLLMATTPPKEEDHPFFGYWERAELNNSLIIRTIYDCPRITPKMIDEYMEEAGGESSENWQREYLCKRIRSQELTVIPEFTEIARSEIVQPVDRPVYVDKYTSMDLGFVDYTGILFAFYDFVNARVVIEDEMLVNRENTSIIAARLREHEEKLWPGQSPYLRISDSNNPQFIHDLSSLHGFTFSPDPRVGSKEQRINKLRLMIQRRELVISPRCKNLIQQLQYCRWKTGERLTFQRSETHGHYDLVDALIILVNNIVCSRNPVPSNYNIQVQTHTFNAQPKNHPLTNLVNPAMRKIRRPF